MNTISPSYASLRSVTRHTEDDIRLLRQIAAGLPEGSALRGLFTPDMLMWTEKALRENRRPDLHGSLLFAERMRTVSRDALRESQSALIKARAALQEARSTFLNLRFEMDVMARTNKTLADKYLRLAASRERVVSQAQTTFAAQHRTILTLKARLFDTAEVQAVQ